MRNVINSLVMLALAANRLSSIVEDCTRVIRGSQSTDDEVNLSRQDRKDYERIRDAKDAEFRTIMETLTMLGYDNAQIARVVDSRVEYIMSGHFLT